MTHHTLNTGNWRFVGRASERCLDCCGFDFVVDFRAGSVGVDILNIFRVEPGVLQGHVDARNRPAAFGVNIRDPVGVCR